MNRLEFAARLYGHLRMDRTGSPARLAITAACASKGERGATVAEIALAIGDPDARCLAGGVSKIEDTELIQRVSGSKPLRFIATQKGLQLIAPCINPKPIELSNA